MTPRVFKKAKDRSNADALFVRASEQWDKGKLLSAFRLFLAGAKAGDSGAQVNLGYFYHHGIGIKPSSKEALKWYKIAYFRGERCAASNIGFLFRDEQKYEKAIQWFTRAVKLQDGDANLQIAKIYLEYKQDIGKTAGYLQQIYKFKVGEDVLESSVDEARALLKKIRHKR